MREIARYALFVAALAACKSQPRSADESGTAAGAPAASGSEDADRPTGGGGVPTGFLGRTDRPSNTIAEVRYVTKSPSQWEITTGPAHILWAAGDTARGSFTVATTIEQLEAPTHAEAYGLFIGGRDLDQPTQTYTYLVVRGTGEYLVRVREGDATRTAIPWSKNDAVPVQDARGRATYRLAIRAGADSVRFLVNGTQVGAVAAGSVPTDGIFGLRVNHNLHVQADRVRSGD